MEDGLGSTITYQDTLNWPEGRLDEMIDAGVVVRISPTSEIQCGYCHRSCFVEPVRQAAIEGGACMVHFCEDMGKIIEFSAELFRQWELIRESALAIGVELPAADSYISYDHAGSTLGVSRATISNMVNAGRLEDNGFAGKHRKVLKSSVLLEKERREQAQLEADVLELRRDSEQVS